MTGDKRTAVRSSKGESFISLGPLEADILAFIWEHDRVTVRDVYDALARQRSIAYTTVMTVMGNLTKKGLLSQTQATPAYIYVPAIDGDEVASAVLDSIVAVLYRGRSHVAAAHLLGLQQTLDPAQFEEVKRFAHGIVSH